MMLLTKQKKKQAASSNDNRILISVMVIGSPGPIRLVVNQEELVAAVIYSVLKSYARAARFPILGTNLNSFFLYCPASGAEALSPWETIGSHGFRNFVLCKKPEMEKPIGNEKPVTAVQLSRKGHGSWRAWFNKSSKIYLRTRFSMLLKQRSDQLMKKTNGIMEILKLLREDHRL